MTKYQRLNGNQPYSNNRIYRIKIDATSVVKMKSDGEGNYEI